jgi:RNA polymerase subunit RPABC4/transcription elongation factor Spt4
MTAITPQRPLPGGSIGRELQKTLLPGETVLTFAQGKANQLLMATDQRVIIIKGAIGSGGTFFGTTSLTFFYPQVMGIQVRKRLGDGFVEISAAGVQNGQYGRTGQINAPNIVPFNGWDENRFQEVAMVIRQQMQRMYQNQAAPMQNIVIAVGDQVANDITISTTNAIAPSPNIPVSTFAAPSTPPAALYHYRLWEVIALIGVYLLGLPFSSTDLGPLFFIVPVAYACVRDWSGVSTLRQKIQWSNMGGSNRLWATIGLVCFYPLIFFYYLWQIAMDFFQYKKQVAAQRPHQIAQLEAQLGILPVKDGVCRACHKPLQLGAEFCAFCGETAIEKPLICPNCATIVLPGASFCPKCRTALSENLS